MPNRLQRGTVTDERRARRRETSRGDRFCPRTSTHTGTSRGRQYWQYRQADRMHGAHCPPGAGNLLPPAERLQAHDTRHEGHVTEHGGAQ
ncbi:hypothetical protein GCM10018779_52690 [Streptomyces griseocarneus]|nr:hypothetical protein GCM10018779_52690 [Streptomyces griseocarneus]